MSKKRSLFTITMAVLVIALMVSFVGIETGQAATNLVVNPGFETGSLSPWGSWNNSVVTGNAHSGTYAMRVGKATGSGEQTITGLTPNTAYTLKGWVKTSATSVTAWVGVKNFGGTETYQTSTSTTYTQKTVTFTTGASNTSAKIYCYKSTTSGYVYCDDFELTSAGAGPTPTPGTGQVLVWSDEFNDTTIDTSKWGYEIGYIRGNEYQYYTDRAANSYETGGNLVIKAIRENYQGYAYTSASLNTYGKASWTYGTFEMRARIPTALGTWPAWWWLGNNFKTGASWPACGEIDMMEFYRGVALYNVMDSGQHWFSYTEPYTDSTNYHIWKMEWVSASNIKLYRDDVLKLTYTGGDAAFTRPGYMLVNLAIGGNSGGDPSGTSFPQYYYIDYIRVYQ